MLSGSVVICTRNRAELLADTVRSVLADSSPSRDELIVVDNGSTDTTAQVASDFPVRHVWEPQPGHSRARNAGIRAASAEVVVFTDDDVRVANGWCDAMIRPFDDPTVQVVGGNITPVWSAPPPKWLDHRLAQYLALPRFGEVSRELSIAECPVGASIAFRRTAVQEGPFSPRLGHQPGLSYGNDEIAVVRALLATGGRAWYAADARVQHLIDTDRLRLSMMRRTHFQIGVSTARVLGGDRSGISTTRAGREIGIWTVKLASATRRRRRLVNADTVADECQAAMGIGMGLENLLGGWPDFVDAIARRFPG